MDKKDINDLISWFVEKRSVIDYEQIPEIDLYMDQLTTFMDERLKGYKRDKTDKILTKTMINNYTKDNVLPPPEKKKYNKEQISLLIIIYHLKSALTINDISAVFDYMESEEISVENAYKAFAGITKREKSEFAGRAGELLDEAEKNARETDGAGKALILNVIMTLIVEANSRSQLAERLIDMMKTK